MDCEETSLLDPTSPCQSRSDSHAVHLNETMEPRRTERSPTLILRVNGTIMSIGILSLPLFAFITVIVISILKDFRDSTATHCRVANFLPSISAAISCCTPQRYIWRMAIALHCAPRFMIAVMYYNHYNAFPVKSSRFFYQLCIGFNSFLHMAENFCLMLLSYVMSHENYGIHEKGFIGFMIFSLLYMMSTLYVFRWSRSTGPWSERDVRSYRWKIGLFVFNLTAFLVSVYFFFRHNAYCEPGMYSVYSLLEYFVVFSNIAFHATAIFEIGRGELVFSEVPVEKLHLKAT